jgi:hypothetical protein
VDNRPNLVGNFEPVERAFASRSPDPQRVAPSGRLTALRTLGARSPVRRAPERVRRALSEAELIRGYGLDPDDFEGELGRW